MIPVCKATAVLLLCVPFQALSQEVDEELPFPLLKGMSMVVKTHYSYMPPLPAKGWSRDTSSIFLVSPDGYVNTQYFCEAGNCAGKISYTYKEGKLVKTSHFSSADHHILFSNHSAYNHPLLSENTWEYKGGKLVAAKATAGAHKTVTRECRYSYDRLGRLIAEYYSYPKQSLVHYPSPYDAIVYEYDGDSVYKLLYVKDAVADSASYMEHHNKDGQVTERWQISNDGKHYVRELSRYDSIGRIIEFQYLSDLPSVKADGSVIRADRVEYLYNAEGRVEEVRYFAHGIRRWAYRYDYLK